MESHQSRLPASRLKIALIGYGKMGKIIEQLALKDGHEIITTIHSTNTHLLKSPALEKATTCIDFSHPSCIVKNIEQMAKLGKNLVIGTTGWDEQLEHVKSLVDSSSIGLLYSPNFSIGVSLFLKMIAHAASTVDFFTEYDVGGFETHHHQKKDSPSGTAKAIGQLLLQNLTRKKNITYGHPQEHKDDSIHFTSLRCGSITGDHSVVFDSPFDAITLTHSAKNREGFAKGALLAAQWLQGKRGFFTFSDTLEDIYG